MKRRRNLVDETDHLKSEEHKIRKKFCHREACEKNISANCKSSHLKSTAHIKKAIDLR